ncbi:MAG: hypothetical protein Q8S31_07045 [Alphaproteobacteria bacterium]|nr:hypothetical protein [Alphaproteobacteria bacterium]
MFIRFFVFMFFTLFLEVFAHAEPKFEVLEDVDLCIDDTELQRASPLYGYIANRSFLKNWRFFGNYGLRKEGIKIMDFSLRPLDDYPHDHVASFIQCLFPSFDMRNFIPNQILSNPVSQLKPSTIAKLIHTIIDANYVYSSEEFSNRLSEILIDEFKKDAFLSYKSSCRKKILSDIEYVNNYINSKSCKSLKLFKEILIQALIEAHQSDLYPKYIIEHTLLAFLWKKSDNAQDLNEYLAYFSQKSLGNKESSFTSENYKKLTSNLKNIPQEWEELIKKPSFASYLLFGDKIFFSTFPLPLTYGRANYKNQEFSDCMETAIRNMIGYLIYNPSKAQYIIPDHLCPPDAPIRIFYEKYNSASLQNTQDARNEWASLVSALPNVIYLKGDHEAKASIVNLVKILAHLFVGVFETVNEEDIKALILESKMDEDGESSDSEDQSEENEKILAYCQENLFEFIELFDDWLIDNLNSIESHIDETLKFSLQQQNIFQMEFEPQHANVIHAFQDKTVCDVTEKILGWEEKIDPYVFKLCQNKKGPHYAKESQYIKAIDIYNFDLSNIEESLLVLKEFFKRGFLFDDFFIRRFLRSLPLQDRQIRYKIYEAFSVTGERYLNFGELSDIIDEINNLTTKDLLEPHNQEAHDPYTLLDLIALSNCPDLFHYVLTKNHLCLGAYFFYEYHNFHGSLVHRLVKKNNLDIIKIILEKIRYDINALKNNDFDAYTVLEQLKIYLPKIALQNASAYLSADIQKKIKTLFSKCAYTNKTLIDVCFECDNELALEIILDCLGEHINKSLLSNAFKKYKLPSKIAHSVTVIRSLERHKLISEDDICEIAKSATPQDFSMLLTSCIFTRKNPFALACKVGNAALASGNKNLAGYISQISRMIYHAQQTRTPQCEGSSSSSLGVRKIG